MNKQEYLDKLLVDLTENNVPNIDTMIEFYSEMIEDRMEDGMSEEEAVAAMDSVDQVVSEAVVEKPITTLVKDKIKKNHNEAKKKGHGAIWAVLVVLGFPVWFPLCIAFVAVVFSIFVTLWAVVVSLYAVNFSLAATAIGLFVGAFSCFIGTITFHMAILCWAASFIIGGLFFLFMVPVMGLAKGLVAFIKLTFRKLKTLFV